MNYTVYSPERHAVEGVSLTGYQTGQVIEWMRDNPGKTWTPSEFGWVFFPWMVSTIHTYSRTQ